MTEAPTAIDVTTTKSGIDSWLVGIKPFPREWVIDKAGMVELVDGLTVEVPDPDDADKKIALFTSPKGILIAKLTKTGTVDLRATTQAEAKDYALYGKVVKKAIANAQRILSFRTPVSD